MEPQTRVVPVQLADGTRILAEASSMGGEEDVAALDQVLSLEQVTSTIESLAASLCATIARVKPDKASIEFGIDLAVESGALTAMITKGSAKGNLKLSLTWEQDKKSAPTK